MNYNKKALIARDVISKLMFQLESALLKTIACRDGPCRFIPIPQAKRRC